LLIFYQADKPAWLYPLCRYSGKDYFMAKSASLLCAFRHPLVLISILVLLFNDHVLKASIPSALTGKLSDVAGLFFFPFLGGTILQALVKLAWPSRRWRARQALVASFVLCFVIFTGIKTIPAANEYMAGLLSALFHLPVSIALDPTDLVAFLVFIPAWLLWVHIEQGWRPAVPGKLEYVVLGLSTMACVATSPCMPVSSIQRLITINDTLYARMDPDFPAGFVSHDAGNTWEEVQPIPADILSDMAGPPAMPLTLCDPIDVMTCFRITGQPWVEGSQDGGANWQVVWQIPPERESYLRRANTGGCGKTPNIIPLDMAFITQPAGSTLVIAMGNEGVVIHPSSGGWQRAAVGPFMVPTPITASNLDEAFNNIAMESILGLVGAVLIYLGLSLWAWIFATRHASPMANHRPAWVFRPARFAVAWILLVVALPVLIRLFRGPFTNAIEIFWLFALVTLPFGILLISLVIWIRAGSLAARPGRYRLYGWVSLGTGLTICAVFIGCLLLWALGVIALYEIALIIAAAVSASILVWVVIRMRRGMKMALSRPDTVGG
jgi:hypothetical protein